MTDQRTSEELIELVENESGYFLEYLEARTDMLKIPEAYEEALYALIVRKMLGAIFYANGEQEIAAKTELFIKGVLEEIEDWKDCETA